MSLPVSSNSVTEDLRMSAIHTWLTSIVSPSLKVASLRAASADASFRRYFRIDGEDGKTYIVMDAPQPAEDVRPFIKIAELFTKINLSIPDILAQDVEQGFLLLTDLGTTTYFNALNNDTAHKLYLDAIDSLILMQAQSQADVLPEYDREFLLRELMIFPEWYIGKHLGLTLTTEQSTSLNNVFEALLANIVAQPQVYVHRDYHSRNLMVLDKSNPGILDFQGALYGPLTYDLVSLLRDAYVQWDEEMVIDWAIRYWEKARAAGLPVSPDVDNFYRDFEFMGLQRHLKILGIFARLAHRDGKDAYLQDMPLVMTYVRKTAQRYNILIPLLRLLDVLEDTAPQIGYTF
ncbi:phosphotransferase [Undibacterium sp. 5I1]|uniref:aminoglycoside phosphotransferase family protein n=1 Tax=unclassified Undibacterium TaxID=2630295 RepID=UPI002AB35E9D|nr:MULTISPECIES: phosphotransferase [unclassified Undibacterium]MDY7536662.1 phosphotransferase [Undibacterium sp. 5I1]MEB0230293.1 phosphotransferase [Undibacterium sp. 10I3]MEB0257993.1 phosphotransferase [Undibacterium sp. 5I1]